MPMRLSGKIIMSFVPNSVTRSASQNSSRPGASGLNRLSLMRALTQWLGVKAKSQPPARVAAPDDQNGWRLHKDPMFKVGEEMLRQSRRDNQPLSVLVFELRDLPELECVFGSRVAKKAVAKMTAKLERMATSKGLALRTGPTIFTVLLPGVGRDSARAGIHAMLGQPCCIEFDAGDDEIVLVPEFMVQTVCDTESLQEVYEGLCSDIKQSPLTEQRRQKYLERQRESHSGPMELQVTRLTAPPRPRPPKPFQAVYSPMPATIPMPMDCR